MIVVLYCVAVVLILGGAAASLFGADTIRNESGAAWLQTGAVWAAGGFVLLALAAILAELRRIRRALADMALEVHDVPVAAPPPPPQGAPVAMAAGGAILAGAGLAAAMAGRPAEASSAALPAEVRDDPSGPTDAITADRLPDPPIAGPEHTDAATPIEEPMTLDDPELVNPDPDLLEDLVAAAGTDSTPHLVRTYASGGNTYLMYSDGSIEADMDDGRHRFPSMAALRHFVETGEGGERIAPTDQPSSAPATAPTANA